MDAVLPALVANTDPAWFSHFQVGNRRVLVDEVNFWRPSAQGEFRALEAGQPFFFRLKSPIDAVAGFGFFALHTRVSIPLAWEIFGDKNGAPDRIEFEHRLRAYRRQSGRDFNDHLSCLVLRDAVFLPEAEWLPWREARDWHPNIMTYKTYDLAAGPRELLRELLTATHPQPVPDLEPHFQLVTTDNRQWVDRVMVERQGQGTFRLRLLHAYSGQCTVTGERAVPVLEAAHIQPYRGPESNHPQNGLVLRSDLHRLYDGGYITVTPDFHLEVSGRLRDEFENGKVYYAMEGSRIRVPRDPRHAPSPEALRWHAEQIFR